MKLATIALTRVFSLSSESQLVDITVRVRYTIHKKNSGTLLSAVAGRLGSAFG